MLIVCEIGNLFPGTGSFGKVVLAQHRPTQDYYALKMMEISEVIRLKQVDHVRSEKAILQIVNHPFIVNMWVSPFAQQLTLVCWVTSFVCSLSTRLAINLSSTITKEKIAAGVRNYDWSTYRSTRWTDHLTRSNDIHWPQLQPVLEAGVGGQTSSVGWSHYCLSAINLLSVVHSVAAVVESL